MASKATEIAEFLEQRGATPAAAQHASAAIAAAWANREYWCSATTGPLQQCAANSPAMTGDVAELVDQLARYCDVRVHPVREWEPR